MPALTWAVLAVLAYRSLAPDYKARASEDNEPNNTRNLLNQKTSEVVDMGKSVIRELVKAASITVLFHTVGIDALSL